ncbi:hypothetical protein ACFL6B_00020 [Thermodesulfobacteriota bacterium]
MKKNRPPFKTITAICLLACLFFMPATFCAGDELRSFPRELKKLCSGGITVVNTLRGFDLLYIKTRQITAKRKEQIERLKSLGYVGGSFEVEGDHPIIKLPLQMDDIKEVSIKVVSIKKHDFSIRLVLNNDRQEALYRKRLAGDALASQLKKNQNAIIFPVELHNITEPLIAVIEFKNCDMSLAEVHVQ